MRTSSFASSSSDKAHPSRELESPPDLIPQGNDQAPHPYGKESVEVSLELEDHSVVLCNVSPADEPPSPAIGRILSAASSFRRMLSWPRSSSSSASVVEDPAITARNARRMKAKLERTRSSARTALEGLRFINETAGATDANELWRKVEERFALLAKNGLLAREDFGECVGMQDSKEFAVGIFDALARRKKQKVTKISKEELYEFWLQITDQSFDARLQIFFDMADSNEDGKITREEVQELLMLSASANKLSKLKDQAEGYAALIMEELDPENLGYIELWQLEMLLLQKDNYMKCSRQLNNPSMKWSQNLSSLRHKNVVQRIFRTLVCLVTEHWQRGWILLLWLASIAFLFTWKFYQYRNKAAFQVTGYCLPIAKGAAETLKLNMALILLPVCRNTLTWLRSTRARSFVPFDDNINFHKMIACAIAIGVAVHAGNHLACDFPSLINSSPEKFALISSDFHNKKPTYKTLLTGVEGVTGISMTVLMIISFTLATHYFRRNVVRLSPPFNKLTGFNAFWYSHHLLCLVYVLLFIHGSCLYLTHKWHQKSAWMYICVPMLLYTAERTLRTCRSKHYSVKILKLSMLPGNVFSLIMSKPNGFTYKSGQYLFLKCPRISPFEWHPFSITSAPGDDYLSVHIRTVGDWTQELKLLFTDDDTLPSSNGQANFGHLKPMDHRGQPKLLVDGPYGAPAQDYQSYDVLLLIGLGIGATPFISILKDLLNDTRIIEDQMESNTETTTSDESYNSFTSSNFMSGGNKRTHKTTNAYFYWVTREAESFEWFKGVMNEVAELDLKDQIELHNYLTSVYEEGDARSTLITMVQALNHAKHGVDILSGTQVRTHFARPNWKDVFTRIASRHPYSTVGVFYCGTPLLAKELKKLSHELSHKTTTRFDFHKEYF
ncbi:respiratory burst oxidase homolog protein E [Neltuma alba]|uniref:respiratory burst oxidase homolog protein E n=1 Tax=Neltuma alba TaxID=207710 RepID=UPI0010A52EEC|nr:respiratory burst oxidase homolog protein E [Prosopis alba]